MTAIAFHLSHRSARDGLLGVALLIDLDAPMPSRRSWRLKMPVTRFATAAKSAPANPTFARNVLERLVAALRAIVQMRFELRVRAESIEALDLEILDVGEHVGLAPGELIPADRDGRCVRECAAGVSRLPQKRAREASRRYDVTRCGSLASDGFRKPSSCRTTGRSIRCLSSGTCRQAAHPTGSVRDAGSKRPGCKRCPSTRTKDEEPPQSWYFTLPN